MFSSPTLEESRVAINISASFFNLVYEGFNISASFFDLVDDTVGFNISACFSISLTTLVGFNISASLWQFQHLRFDLIRLYLLALDSFLIIWFTNHWNLIEALCNALTISDELMIVSKPIMFSWRKFYDWLSMMGFILRGWSIADLLRSCDNDQAEALLVCVFSSKTHY